MKGKLLYHSYSVITEEYSSISKVDIKFVYRQESFEPGADIILEYKVEGLRPATAYALRLSAVNAIGDSEYSDPVIVQTLQEGLFISMQLKFLLQIL